MKIQLSAIVNSTEQIKSLLEIKLPVKISYKIKRLVDKLNPILKAYEDKRNELVKEFGEQNEDGSFQVKDGAKVKEYITKLTELLEVEEEIDWFEPIKIEELGDVQIEPKNITNFVFE